MSEAASVNDGAGRDAAAIRAGASIVLAGAPGSGKSTVGAALSKALGERWIDVDEQIVAAERTPIAEIFAGRGEPHFRELEVRHTLAALAERAVVSIGGGAVTSPQIREALTGHRVVWLRVGPSEAAKRVGMNVARPLLLGNVRGRLMQLLKERTPLYEEVADLTVDTDGREVADIVAEILSGLDDVGEKR